MKITNPKRKKQIEEFIDEDHEVMNEYYDLLDSNISDNQLMEEMKKIIKKDKDFYDPYMVVADILLWDGKEKGSEKLIVEAYDRAVMRIIDYKGRWPKEMPWGIIENRHLMRALQRYALLLWRKGEVDDALEIFRKIFHVNPNDNQGVRNCILAIRLGLGEAEWCMLFETKGGERLDAINVIDWFDTNFKKFPDEFQWWVDFIEKQEAEGELQYMESKKEINLEDLKELPQTGDWELDLRRDMKLPIGGSASLHDVLFLVQAESYFILTMQILTKDNINSVRETFVDAIVKNQILPKTLLVKDDMVIEDLQLISNMLNFQIEKVNRFKAMPLVIKDFNKNFNLSS